MRGDDDGYDDEDNDDDVWHFTFLAGIWLVFAAARTSRTVYPTYVEQQLILFGL